MTKLVSGYWRIFDVQNVYDASPVALYFVLGVLLDPDAIPGGTWEAFERVLQRSGYFQTGLRKLEAAQTG